MTSLCGPTSIHSTVSTSAISTSTLWPVLCCSLQASKAGAPRCGTVLTFVHLETSALPPSSSTLFASCAAFLASVCLCQGDSSSSSVFATPSAVRRLSVCGGIVSTSQRCAVSPTKAWWMDGLSSDSATLPGHPVILAASYPGSPRAMRQNYLDAMCLVRALGKPDYS